MLGAVTACQQADDQRMAPESQCSKRLEQIGMEGCVRQCVGPAVIAVLPGMQATVLDIMSLRRLAAQHQRFGHRVLGSHLGVSPLEVAVENVSLRACRCLST